MYCIFTYLFFTYLLIDNSLPTYRLIIYAVLIKSCLENLNEVFSKYIQWNIWMLNDEWIVSYLAILKNLLVRHLLNNSLLWTV